MRARGPAPRGKPHSRTRSFEPKSSNLSIVEQVKLVRKVSWILSLVATLVLVAGIDSAASANTRANAKSYMNTARCVQYSTNTTLCGPGQFVVGKGVTVWMNCWTTGVNAMGSGKWFQITVNNNGGKGSGVTGYVPAPAVSNPWTSSPRCG